MTTNNRKKLGILLGILLIILVVGVFAVPWLIDLNHYNAPIVSAIEKALGGTAQLGRITWGLHTGLWLEADGFSLSGATGVLSDVALKRVHADVSLFPLLSGKIVIKNLHLEAPKVSLNLAATEVDGSNDPVKPASSVHNSELKTTPDSPDHPTTTSSEEKAELQSLRTNASASQPSKILITGVTVNLGHVTLNDALTLPSQTIMRTFTDVTIEADYATADQEVTFDLSMRDETENGFGSLTAKGTFKGLTEQFSVENPRLAVRATVKDQRIAALKPYLKNVQMAERLEGSVSFDIDYKGNFGKNGQAAGVIDLSHLTYTDKSLWETPLPGMETKLNFNSSFTPDELVIDKFNLTLGKITVDGQSRLDNWSAAPVFKKIVLSGDIPLTDLTALVPWKRVGRHADLWKEILEGGGEIRIEKATLPELDPAIPDDLSSLWDQIGLTAAISGLSVQPSKVLPKVPKAENINAAIRMNEGIIKVDNITAEMTAVSLPKISVQISQLSQKPQIETKLNGPIKIADADDESLQKLFSDSGIDKLTLEGDLDLAVQLDSARPENFSIEGTADLKDGLVKTSYSPVVLQNLNADVTLASDTASISNLAATALLPAGKGSPETPVNLALQARLTNLGQRPSLILQSLKTSPISLPALAAVIPWEQFGNAPKVVKDVLHDGGTIEINHLSLPSIDLTEPFNDPDKLLSAAKGSVNLAGVTVRPVLSLPAIEGISGHPSLEKGVLTATDLKARIGPLTTPTMSIQVTHLTDQPQYKVAAKGSVRLAESKDVVVEKILQESGLKSLRGNADVDFDVFYDSAAPGQWSANGSAVLNGFQAVSYPADVKLKDLQGRISFSKQKTHEWVFNNLTAEINAAPVRLNGKISGRSTADLSVDLKAETRQLDIAAISELVPAMKDLGLRGEIDLDMDIHLPHDAPLQNRLTGKLKTDQLALHHKEAAIKIEDINSDLDFTGRSATINRLALRLNEQQVNVTGHLSRPEQPALDLVITSPDLNIDRMLPAKDAPEKPPQPQRDRPPVDTAAEPKRKKDSGADSEMPRFLRLSSANIRLEAQKGTFREQDVADLRITANYEEGVIRNYTLDFNTGGGHAAARGMADLRHPDHVAFTVDPEIKTVPLNTIVSILGLGQHSVDGPLSASGQLKARTGSTRELLASLGGNLDAEIGRGTIKVRDSFGKSLVDMLRFMSLKNLLSGNLIGQLEGDGLSFNSAKASAALKGGRVNISNLEYDGDAFSIDADGEIDLPGNNLKVGCKLAVFDTVGKAVKLVPIVGRAADAVSSLYFTVDGSLDNPKVQINPARGVVKGTEEIITAPERAIEDILKFGKERNPSSHEPE